MTDSRRELTEVPRLLPELALLGAIVVLVVTRLAIQPFAPPSFFVDEAAGGAHIRAMLATGADAHGEKWPLFTEALGGGYTTPVYLYPATAWAKVFGTGELSLRYFSHAATLAGIAALALGARYWLGRWFALLTAVVALALPWGWVQGSIAWDPALAPPLMCAAFLGLTVLLFSANPIRRRLALVALPAALVGAAYVYPPCRVAGPVFFVFCYGLLHRRRVLSLAAVAGSCAFATLLALPLARFMTEPGALGRSEALSVFSGDNTFWAGMLELGDNFWLLLSPVFLFVEGDENLRHSTTRQGMLGAASVLPVLAVVLYVGYLGHTRRDPERPRTVEPLLLGVLAVGVFGSFLGSALTNEGHPHSLRSTAAWPFLAVVVALGWAQFMRNGPRFTMAAVLAFVVGTAVYATDLATAFPDRAVDVFDSRQRERTLNGEDFGYPELAVRYHRGE